MDSESQQSYSYARRRFLVTLGFSAASLAIAKKLGDEAVEPQASKTSQDPLPPVASTLAKQPTIEVKSKQVVEPPHMPDAPKAKPVGYRFDIVIENGRVIDPETGFDAIANVGIASGTIAAISYDPLAGEKVIDASQQLVTPGFVDLLSYEPNPFGVRRKVQDGVTTNLAMHGVNNYGEPFFRRYEGKSLVHYGGAFHQHFMRGEDIGAKVYRPLDTDQINELNRLAASNLAAGFAGVSMSLEYSPGTSQEELDALVKLTTQLGHVCFFHVRYSDAQQPGTGFEAVSEVVDLAERHNASVHIEHLTSTGGTFQMQQVLELLEAKRAKGVDVTACVYPYTFWGTFLASERFTNNWQQRYGLTYDDLQISGTTQRLTKASFAAAKSENKLVAALGSIPEKELEMALQTPWIFIGSDAIATESLNNHPRGAGAFARTLRQYVREKKTLTLLDALAKMTILPTQRVESMIPAMRKKGRMQVGADADVIVFDPQMVSDKATVENPGAPSVGFTQVLIDGNLVIQDSVLDDSAIHGKPLRSITFEDL